MVPYQSSCTALPHSHLASSGDGEAERLPRERTVRGSSRHSRENDSVENMLSATESVSEEACC